MARKKRGQSRRRRHVRTCSVCARSGHNKRTCPEVNTHESTTVLQHKSQKPKAKSQKLKTSFVDDQVNAEEIEQEVDEREDDVVSTLTQKKQSGRAIRVEVKDDAAPSPHVVDLKPEDTRTPVWEQVEAYKEAPSPQPIRKTIDFAAIVREANARAKRERPQVRASRIVRSCAINPLQHKQPSATPTPVMVQTETKKKRRHFVLPRVRLPRIPNPFSPLVRTTRRAHSATVDRIQRATQALQPRRIVFASLAILLVGIVPFPAVGYYQTLKQDSQDVVAASTTGFSALKASTLAAFQSDVGQAQGQLRDALAAFGQANEILDTKHGALQSVLRILPVLSTQFEGRQALLRAGHHIALGNTYLVKGVRDAQVASEQDMTARAAVVGQHITHALPQYRAALKELSAVDESVIPREERDAFKDMRVLFATFVDDLENMAQLIDGLQTIFGAQDFRRYLVIFQNQHEIRATGGFAGSYAIVDVQKGKIQNIDIPPGGTYDVKGQLSKHVAPPVPLQLVNGRWEFQDGNWFPDFAASGEKMAWFYEHSRNATVDGVIAVNASVIERLLRVVGPIENDEYDLLLTADSVLPTLQKQVEDSEDKQAGMPKKVLSSVFDQLVGKMTDIQQPEMMRLLTELNGALREKEIQIYLRDAQEQQTFREYGWTGEIVQTAAAQDYLMVVNSNVQGQKSDAKVQQSISHKADVQSDGSVINTVEITRTHTGDVAEEFYGAANINYLRVYVPKGAELLHAEGFMFPPEDAFKVPEEYYQNDPHLAELVVEHGFEQNSGTRVSSQFDKTVFGNWMIVQPGASETVTLTYRLPFTVIDQSTYESDRILPPWAARLLGSDEKNASRYSLVVQKQSGVESDLVSTVHYPVNWTPRWRSNDAISFDAAAATYTGQLDQDTVLGTVFAERD